MLDFLVLIYFAKIDLFIYLQLFIILTLVAFYKKNKINNTLSSKKNFSQGDLKTIISEIDSFFSEDDNFRPETHFGQILKKDYSLIKQKKN